MIVSWDWLQDYVTLPCSAEQAAERLMMSGLNLEELNPHGSDFAIDLEVTSNRADCLGHIGVARELAALFETDLKIPKAAIKTAGNQTSDSIQIENRVEDHCPHYTARVMTGVKVGPSPDWLRNRLECLGLRSVNNIVDVTNYVLLECGQPLHAFDLDKLQGNKVIVRTAAKGEKIVAIDGRSYELDEQTCVIADENRPVAIAGVMGGQETEVSDGTTNLLIEVAEFTPLSVRRTARKLSLFSDSSFRFERQIDRQQLDWASRRCCELIQQVAGGEIHESPIVVPCIPESTPVEVEIRFAKAPELLGIPIETTEMRQILVSLGLQELNADETTGRYAIPSWRADLTREIDLIEEIARIHGYENISENDPPQVTAAQKALFDRAADLVHRVCNANGFYEAMTLTFVSEDQAKLFNPRKVDPLLKVEHSSRKKDNILRPSLIPSLLQSRRANERTGTPNAQLYEIARVFTHLNVDGASQTMVLSLVSGQDFLALKGLLEQLVGECSANLELTALPSLETGFTKGRGAELYLNGDFWGWIGELNQSVTEAFDLQGDVTVAEVDFEPLMRHLTLAPQAQAIPQFPAMERDFNFLLEDSVEWSKLASTIREAGGPLLRGVAFAGQYRGKGIEPGKKTYLARASFRADDRTLTGDEVDAVHSQIVAACEKQLAATLR